MVRSSSPPRSINSVWMPGTAAGLRRAPPLRRLLSSSLSGNYVDAQDLERLIVVCFGCPDPGRGGGKHGSRAGDG